jgi:hypothetical protein
LFQPVGPHRRVEVTFGNPEIGQRALDGRTPDISTGMIGQPIETAERTGNCRGRTLGRLFVGSPGIRRQVRRLAQFTDRGLDVGERGRGLVIGTTLLRSCGKAERAETDDTDNNEPGG